MTEEEIGSGNRRESMEQSVETGQSEFIQRCPTAKCLEVEFSSFVYTFFIRGNRLAKNTLFHVCNSAGRYSS